MRRVALAVFIGILLTACGGQGAGPSPIAAASSGIATGVPPGDGTPASVESPGGQLPAIVVTTPAEGDSLASPVTISGTANVFEGTVSIRVLDAKGKVIVSDFTTASCGTGCRGDYSKRVAFYSAQEQQGTIEVFEASAKDGKPTNVVSISVTLKAAGPCPPNYVHREGTGECILGD